MMVTANGMRHPRDTGLRPVLNASKQTWQNLDFANNSASRTGRRPVSRLAVVLLAFLLVGPSNLVAEPVTIVLAPHAGPRVEYGATRLVAALKSIGDDATISNETSKNARCIKVGNFHVFPGPDSFGGGAPKPEGFLMQSDPAGLIRIWGGDDSGALYGCVELAQRIHDTGKLPDQINFSDSPAFKVRGPCIGMQKTYILPGRHVYEYPYTPELFPFFYDKQFWTEYLDFLATNRMNTLYLWSGHPFASLVKLPDYPYAMEVPEDVFQKNVEMYRWIAKEADRRGIWVVQMFYNIIVSKPFAEHNHMSTQLAAPADLAADYTRKSIAEFVQAISATSA